MQKIMEKLWLFLAIGGIVVAGYMIGTKGWDEGKLFLVFPVIAGMGYGMRRFARNRFNQGDKE